jgi:hypothetical protein
MKKNKVITLCRFYKGLNNDFRKVIRLIDDFTLNQAYNYWSDYELLIQNKWIKHQDPHNASFRSKNRNDNSLLGASSYKLNPSCAQIYK